MAGMLPGVELARRRRTHHHDNYREPWFLRSRLDPTSSPLDEAAHRARTRLENRLRGHSSTSRWNKHQDTKESSHDSEARETEVKKERGFLGLTRRNSEKDVCAVCLDEFLVQQQIMNLPCSHRYHSDCVLPWLNIHSHCPCCRTHVPS